MKCSGFVLDCQAWLASPTVDNMSGAEVKAYLFLLARSWLEEPMATLPNNDEALARIARVTPERWDGMRDVILSKFTEDGDGRIYNERLMQQAMKLFLKQQAGAAGWTDARKKVMAHVARQNGKKHKAKTKAKTKAETKA